MKYVIALSALVFIGCEKMPLNFQDSLQTTIESVAKDSFDKHLGGSTGSGNLAVPIGSDVQSEDWNSFLMSLVAAFVGGLVLKRPKAVTAMTNKILGPENTGL